MTLMELIAVIVILSVLAGVAVPIYMDRTDQARAASARGARGSLATAVHLHFTSEVARTGYGAFPADLDDVLETHQGDDLLNPYRDAAQPLFEVDAGATPAELHTSDKTIEDAVGSGLGAIWYNPSNGAVRFRVPRQATATETLTLYNHVNMSSITSLSQTTG